VTPVLELAAVSRDYRGLRPLRIAELRVGAGERVALAGLDAPAAEVFVNLATGAVLPDAGEVTLFGRATSAIADSADWLATVDRVGIVSDRAVLLEELTAIQNLAMPFTLDIEPPPEDVRARAAAIAREVGLPEVAWSAPVSRLDPAGKVRVRLGRAVALDPALLLLEHASASVARGSVAGLAADIAAVASARNAAVVALSADDGFARAVATRILTLQPATGVLKERRRGWF
jgi:predicted ABC-type transport system involved in lysophospholipase L1 biosynthesis ATPase subunit